MNKTLNNINFYDNTNNNGQQLNLATKFYFLQ